MHFGFIIDFLLCLTLGQFVTHVKHYFRNITIKKVTAVKWVSAQSPNTEHLVFVSYQSLCSFFVLYHSVKPTLCFLVFMAVIIYSFFSVLVVWQHSWRETLSMSVLSTLFLTLASYPQYFGSHRPHSDVCVTIIQTIAEAIETHSPSTYHTIMFSYEHREVEQCVTEFT